MAEDNQDEFVRIRGAGQDADVVPARVTRKAYDLIWSGKGYTLVDDDEAALADSPATQAELAGAEAGPSTSRRSTKKGE